jgi:hypothetical protein
LFVEYLTTREQRYLIAVGDLVSDIVKEIIPLPGNIYASYIEDGYKPLARGSLAQEANSTLIQQANKAREGDGLFPPSNIRTKSVMAQAFGGGCCGENSALAFRLLRQYLNGYLIVRCADTIHDHAFCLVLKPRWTIDQAIAVDPWPPKQQACLFKHYSFFKYVNAKLTLEKFAAMPGLDITCKIADGKNINHTNNKNYSSVQDKYSQLYGFIPPTAEQIDQEIGNFMQVNRFNENPPPDELRNFCRNKDFYFLETLTINGIIYQYIFSSLYDQFITKLDPIIELLTNWGYAWYKSQGLLTLGRKAQGEAIIQHLNLVARRKSTVDFIAAKCQAIGNYSALIIVTNLLLYMPPDKSASSLLARIQITGMSYGFTDSPLEKLKNYYCTLLSQETDPNTLNDESVQLIKLQLNPANTAKPVAGNG